MENINEVKESINVLREKLYVKIDDIKDLDDEKVVELSGQLDYLIIEYIKIENIYKLENNMDKL